MSEVIAVSEAASLAFHGMALLASGGRMSAKEMAEAVKVSEAHLAKVFQRLAREGLVSSTRGPGGGFELARPAEEISLYDVYVAVEGAPSKGDCLLRRESCPFGSCIMGSTLRDIKREFVDYLKSATLRGLRRGEEG